jgi:hypothetical protein
MTTRRGLHGGCAVRDTFVGAMDRSGTGGRRIQSPNRSSRIKTLEKCMKFVKTSAIAFAISALLAGPVLAQGAASDTQTRGGAQGRINNMQGGASGSGDEEFDAQQRGAPGTKAGVNAKAGAKGTVGAGRGATKGSAGTVGDPAASGGKRY